MSTAAPPGWHPDPSDPTALRWWDGNQWTGHTSPGAGYAPGTSSSPGSPPPPPPPATNPTQSYPGSIPAPQNYPMGGMGTGFGRGYGRTGRVRGPNSFSLTAIVVGAIYLVIAVTTGIVFLGIFPVFSTYRAFQRREKLAPLAAVVTVVVIGSAIYFYGHHRNL